MLDIGKLIQGVFRRSTRSCFSSMLDIGKLIPYICEMFRASVLAQCWI